MSGDYAAIGEEINQGALLAVDEARARGVNVEYISEDDGFQPQKSVSAAQKLLDVDKVNAVMTSWAPEVKPIAPLFNKDKFPLLAVWDNTGYMKTAGPYIFTIGFSTEANAGKMAEFAFNNINLRKVAVLYQVEEWSQLISQSFVKKFQDLGGQVILNQSFQLSDRDFRTYIVKIKNSGADGVYFPMNANANSVFLIQAKQLGFKSELMTGDAFIQDEIKAAGSASQNVYFTNIYAEQTSDLAQKYKAEFHTDLADPVVSSFGYDGVNVLLEAYNIATTKGISLRDALTQVKIVGAGSLINLDGGQYSDRVEKIYKVINGEPVEVKK